MHLILGSPTDPFCLELLQALAVEGHSAQVVSKLFEGPSIARWRFDSDSSSSAVVLPDARELSGAEIESVFIAHNSGLDVSNWNEQDGPYAYHEAQAALLGWLWSLPCPVVNRLPAQWWYYNSMPLAAWQPLLGRAGFTAGSLAISNVASALRRFAGPTGAAVYSPLASSQCYMVASESEWQGIEQLTTLAPVCLSRPHRQPVHVCAVGSQLFWNMAPPAEACALECSVARLRDLLKLDWLSVALARFGYTWHVVGVETLPQLCAFDAAARAEIIHALVRRLTSQQTTGCSRRLGDSSMRRNS
jgi:hypothetical protein